LSISDTCTLSVEVISDPQGTPDLMEFWQAQAQHATSDPDFFSMVVSLRENVLSPLVFLVREKGVPVTALICRLEKTQIPARIAYFKLARFSLRSITAVYGGLIGTDTPAIRRKLLDTVFHELRRGRADVATLSMLRADSAFVQSVDALSIANWRLKYSLLREHFVFQVPAKPEDILLAKPSKTRSKIRYYMRRAEKNLPDLQVNRVDSSADIDQMMRDLESVASKTYQRGLGAGFHNNEEWRALLNLGFEKNWMEVWTLSTGAECISFIIGLKYKGRYLIYAKAFDPGYSDDRIGTYLQIKLLEDIVRQGECAIVDYGFGEAEYKRQFSTDNWPECNVLIAAASIRNFAIMNIVRFCDASDKTLRMVSEKLALTRRVKKALRSNKAKTAKERH